MRKRLSTELLDSFKFYATCDSRENHDLTPPNLPVSKITAYYDEVAIAKDKLDGLLFSLFDRSSDVLQIN
jgi:hypothetical protein